MGKAFRMIGMGRVFRIALYVVLIGVIMGSIVYGFNRLVGVIDIVGRVSISSNIEMIPSRVKVDLGTIDTTSGAKNYSDIAKLVVRNSTKIIARVEGIPGGSSQNLSIAFSGTLRLDGQGRSYVISMPCLYSNTQCARILVLIPGYDTPLAIERGEYRVSLEITWIAEGSGDLSIAFSIQIYEAEQ